MEPNQTKAELKRLHPVAYRVEWFFKGVLLPLFGLSIVSAGVYLYFASIAGDDEFQKICEEQAGVRVYREESAEGFFDNGYSCLLTGCWGDLLNTGFRYVETSDMMPGDENIADRRYFRYTVTTRNDPACLPRFLDDVRNKVVYNEWWGNKDICVTEEEIPEPSARYERRSSVLTTLPIDNFFNSRVARRYHQIWDRVEQKALAEQTIPSLIRNSLPLLSSFQTYVSCSSYGDFREKPPVTWVQNHLQPIAD